MRKAPCVGRFTILCKSNAIIKKPLYTATGTYQNFNFSFPEGLGKRVPASKKRVKDYPYGFQGQESDDEIKGEGNSVNYTFRMHDPRIGRFFAIDPLTKKYPHYTPYSFSGNKVIHCIELEGLEEIVVIGSPGSTANLTNVTTASVINSLAGQSPSSGNSNSTTTNSANPPNVSSVPPAPSGTGFDVSVQSAVVIWDPTARDRGQGGQIQYVGVNGIGTQMRGLTQNELADPFINAAVTMNTESASFQRKHDEATPTDMSGGVSSASPFEGTTTIEASRFVVVTGPPSPVTLRTPFIADSWTPVGGAISAADNLTLAGVANTLNSRPSLSFNLSGTNISSPPGTMMTALNGARMTVNRLGINRANVMRNSLINNFSVNPRQLSSNYGGQTGQAVVNGSFNSTGGSAPNNGNMINIVRP